MHTQCAKLLEKILSGNNHLTKQEIGEALSKAGIPNDDNRVNYIVTRAESLGLVCSGIDKNKKPTYALLDERIAPTKELHKDEALAKLAKRYFRSHSPASFQDFLWWSGLSITETRHAIHLIEEELIKDRFVTQELFVHQSWNEIKQPDKVLHLLPSYDEYLISYKDRTAALPLEHHSKAFNNYGIFHPVIMYNGKIVGNWKKGTTKGKATIETSFFDKKVKINKSLIKKGEERYLNYLLK